MWESDGYSGRGNVLALLGSLGGATAIICGGAETMFADHAKAWSPDCVVFAVNDAIEHLPGQIHHAVSLHGNKLKHWGALRALDHPELGWKEHTNWKSFGCEITWEIEPALSLSGYFAMQVAYLMGAGRIILCGCPGDSTRKFCQPAPRADYSYGSGITDGDKRDRLQLINEMDRLPEFKAKVRSMSGWSKEFFGEP